MFNLAIDSKLRGCDVLGLKVDDIAPHGYMVDCATVRQSKTGRPVKFELTEQTRQAVDDYLGDANRKPGQFLFTSSRGDRPVPGDALICSASLRMDRQHRAGCQAVRHPFIAANEGDVDLSAYWQSASCSSSCSATLRSKARLTYVRKNRQMRPFNAVRTVWDAEPSTPRT